jgi:hypothetical protein
MEAARNSTVQDIFTVWYVEGKVVPRYCGLSQQLRLAGWEA